jgi:hypothetical protein
MTPNEPITATLEPTTRNRSEHRRSARLNIAVGFAEVPRTERTATALRSQLSPTVAIGSPTRQVTAPGASNVADQPRPLPSVAPDPHVSSSQSSTPATTPDRSRSSNTRRALLLSGVALLIVNLVGLSYYLLEIGERVRHPLHPWLKPSGYVGQSAGILAFVMFMVLYLYPLRRRFRVLAFTGPLNRWLDVHIVLGLLVPLIGAVHASWRFKGMIGLGYVSMLLVSLSGVIGRYLYTRIPRGRSGLELTREEIERRRNGLLQQIASTTGIELARIESVLQAPHENRGTGLGATIKAMLTDDVSRWLLSRRLRQEWRRAAGRRGDSAAIREALRLARREVALTQQVRMLDATQRVFRLWHVAHRPFSATAFAAVLIHVIVVIGLGVTWIW